jgi:hypothetical protein
MYRKCTYCLLHWLVTRMTIQQSNQLPDLRTWRSLDDLVPVPLLCIGHNCGCTIGRNRSCSSDVAVAVDVDVVDY